MNHSSDAHAIAGPSDAQRRWLFLNCFIALVATSFAFMIRAMIGADWGAQFGFSETQVGELFGAGLWPFAISIILFSLVIDKIGYKQALVFAFVCHVVSVLITIMAPRLAAEGDGFNKEMAYNVLYAGNFIAALAAGTVEAVINPVIATVYWKQKTKWLNILHAGWPGGIVIAGVLTLSMGAGGVIATGSSDVGLWQWKVGLLLIPTFIYGLMMFRSTFPVNERVAAGVPYMDMLREFGAAGAFIALAMVFMELGNVFGWLELTGGWYGVSYITIGCVVVLTGIYLAVSRSLGRPLFIFLLLVMILLATTELGTDSWIKSLMTPVTERRFGISGGWVLVYTATIMMVLRLCAGPITRRMNPLIMLAVSSLFAAAGLAFLSISAGLIILAAATIYGIGQTFFWPTTLGLIAERFPRGGALTLNAIAGVGMLGVGILGAPFLGLIQDRHTAAMLHEEHPAIYSEVIGETQISVLGYYEPIDAEKIAALPAEQQAQVTDARNASRKSALVQVAILPLIMFVCYLGLLVYFKSRGGYRAETLIDENLLPPAPTE